MLRLTAVLRRTARRASSSARSELAALHHVLFNYGLCEGVCNHLSVMSKEGGEDVMLITPNGQLWNAVTASSLVAVTENEMKMEVIGTTEAPGHTIHWSFHRARPDARVVAHTHAPYATALSNLRDPRLKMCHQNCLRFYGDIAYDLDYNGVSTDLDEGTRLAERLGPHAFVLLMQSHGVTVIGDTVAEAFDRLYYFERSCQTYLTALASGQPLNDVEKQWGEERCLQFRDYCLEYEKESAPMNWAAHLRQLRNSGSNFED